ncbi:MAG: hypothetical protein DMG09_20710, partial [Acidobacteria bacterium]
MTCKAHNPMNHQAKEQTNRSKNRTPIVVIPHVRCSCVMNGAVPCVSFEQTHSFCNVKTIIPVIRPFVLTLLILANLAASTVAQEVSIPDPGLNATIREVLQKPIGPLTEQDLLSLTNLNARS